MFHFSFVQSIVIGLLQGVTELFPVSSLGHAVLVPAWLGGSWKQFAESPQYLLVAIAFHLASAVALFIVFRKRWFTILSSLLKRGSKTTAGALSESNSGFSLLLRLVAASIPLAIIGLALNKFFERNFSKPLLAGVFLFINGFILFAVERLTNRSHPHSINKNPDMDIVERISIPQSVIVGVGQSAALFAGISRFGISISFGMMRGLSRSVAADFAFLLAFPAILGASLLKLPKLFEAGAIDSSSVNPLLVGTLVSFIATYFSVTFLVRYFKQNSLHPFALYCLAFGALSILRFGILN